MTGRYLLAIDAGTGSCRAVLFTEQGRQVAHCLQEWTHREPPDAPGGQDFDVAANWRLVILGMITIIDLGSTYIRSRIY